MSLQNKLCVSIAQGRKEQIIDKAKKYPFIEFCLEKLDCTVEELDFLRNYINRVIISCNIKTNTYTAAEKQTVLNRLLSYIECEPDIVDIPICLFDDKNQLNGLLDKINSKNKKILISYHKYDCFGSINEFDAVISKMKMYNPAYYKLAVKCKDVEEANIFLSLYKKYPELKDKLILVPMIKEYPISRLRSLALGSAFMYCCDDVPVADGQMSYDKMFTILKSINHE